MCNERINYGTYGNKQDTIGFNVYKEMLQKSSKHLLLLKQYSHRSMKFSKIIHDGKVNIWFFKQKLNY